ncbi:hypothetical protein COV49_02365, partial [Candidatus Falkowbacteria bacterium CG11_big_fil_rev_8_21_14_0_20_39_10]
MTADNLQAIKSCFIEQILAILRPAMKLCFERIHFDLEMIFIIEDLEDFLVDYCFGHMKQAELRITLVDLCKISENGSHFLVSALAIFVSNAKENKAKILK